MMPKSEFNILDAAKRYTDLGWIIHPLSSPDSKEKTAGKRPIEKGWQEKTNPRTEEGIIKFWGPNAKSS